MIQILIAVITMITPEEKKLFNEINTYRAKHGLPAIELCDSLSYVASMHSRDIYFHFNFYDKTCSMHSWSMSKFWTGGCINSRDNASIMWNKPREIAGMDVDGFEIAHMHDPKDDQCSADCALDNWQASPSHDNIILERGWRRWKRMGVSIYKGVATVWFADH
jgi:hypothetical protein